MNHFGGCAKNPVIRVCSGANGSWWLSRFSMLSNRAEAWRNVLRRPSGRSRLSRHPGARGRRQITDEAVLLKAIDKILEQQRVKGLLEVAYEKQVEQQTQYVGRGRGSDQRAQRLIERVRYQITAVVRNETAIDKAKQGFGWKAFVTSVSKAQLSLSEAVGCYRKEYRVERIFNRLKSRLNIAPLFVRREDQITGMTHLLSLGGRVLSLLEFVVRRSLQQDQATLAELHPENGQKTTAQPTAERLLKAFSKVSLTRCIPIFPVNDVKV